MKTRNTGLKIGILGGGQLARMLALAAHPLGYIPYILSLNPNDPAAQVVSHWIKGDPDDPKAQRELLSQVDVATFESEFLDGKKLAESLKRNKTPVFPRPLSMHQLRDRLSQKKLLMKYNVPTADFAFAKNTGQLEKVLKGWPKGVVFKSRTGGYDGYGTHIYDGTGAQLPSVVSQAPQNYIIEDKILFQRELAISFFRSSKGQIVSLPWVESHQTDARCDWVVGPVHSRRIEKFTPVLENFVREIRHVGALAFEVFDTGKELLVNEIAPRVHNSAHYSMDAMSEGQFVLHLKAVAGDVLHSPLSLAPFFAMANLLGGGAAAVKIPNDLGARLHWYGKADNRKGRKMGHINVLGGSAEKALKLALAERRNIKL